MKKPSKKNLKFLADESLGLQVARNIARLGYDIVSVAQIARGSADAEVLTRASNEKRILITTDKDFGFLVFKEKIATEGIILLRLKKESIESLTSYLANFISEYSKKIRGNFCVITEDKVRFKKTKQTTRL